MSTIAAISTPNAVGGIAVVRISGEKSIPIAEKFVRISHGRLLSSLDGYTCAYALAVDSAENIVDDVVVTVFRAPKSYTGEDVVEISCHGGLLVSRQILRLALDNGASLAQAGEFTKRAFINGKINLMQAEAVMDIISADGNAEKQAAISLKNGNTYKKIQAVKDIIVSILADLAAWADYPDEDIPVVNSENLMYQLIQVLNDLDKLSKSYDYGRIIKDGIKTVIIGKPNAGKSTLMNLLCGCDRSIVTDIAGTTRDIIEEMVILGDVKLRLFDTAGIRQTGDIVENIGVNRAKSCIENAQLVLAVFDAQTKISSEDLDIIDMIMDKTSIALINKTDADSVIQMDEIYDKFGYILNISAKYGRGIDELESEIRKIFLDGFSAADGEIISNERHKSCIFNAQKSIEDAVSALENGEFLDAVTVLIEDALDSLLELTGERVSDTVVNEVFSRFCVGK